MSSLEAEYVCQQGRNWDARLRCLYEACMRKAVRNDMFESAASVLCIVLNVLIVGRSELAIPNVAVSIFVVFTSIIKAIQLQFQFAICASELHTAKKGLREVIVKVEDMVTAGRYGRCPESLLVAVRRDVREAIDTTPQFVNVIPVELGGGLAPAGSKPGARFPPREAGLLPGSSGDGQQSSDLCAQEPIFREQDRDVEVISIGKSIVQDVQHTMVPTEVPGQVPLAPPAVQAGLPHRTDLEYDVEALVSVVGNNPKVVDAATAIQRTILQKLSLTLDSAVKLTGYWDRLLHFENILATAIELLLNSVIVLASSLTVLEGSSEIVAVCAAWNAFHKGIQMKLKLDVKAAEARLAFQKIKSLREKVNHARLDIDVQNAALPNEAFQDLTNDFQTLIGTYASWIPCVEFPR